MQTSPWLKKTADAAPAIADCRSASSKTTFGLLPPSSTETFLMLPVAPRTIARPVSVDPVKATLATSSWATSAAPASRPKPGTTFSTPGGTPASSASSPSRSALSGVCSAGFSTAVLPQASAGATFHVAWPIG